jgi:hypothetical protein
MGEHGLNGKLVPYEESIRIPLVVRFDSGISFLGHTRVW